MAAFPMARRAQLHTRRGSGAAPGVVTPSPARSARSARPIRRIERCSRIDMALTATVLLVAGSEILLAAWLVVAVAAGLYGLTAFVQ